MQRVYIQRNNEPLTDKEKQMIITAITNVNYSKNEVVNLKKNC